MKKTLSLTVALCMLISLLSGLTISASAAVTGTGTSEDPYLISSAADLAQIATTPSAYFKQTADITGITDVITTTAVTFSGTYDGNGHSIDVTYTAASDKTGLFSITDGATIKNLTLTGSVTNPGIGNMGVYVGTATATTFEGCVNKVTFTHTTANGWHTGGFVGLVKAAAGTSFTNCINDCTWGKEVYSITKCGGIVGALETANVSGISITFTSCANYSDVDGGYGNGAGGFVGCGTNSSLLHSFGLIFNDCFNAGNVSTYRYVSAFVGQGPYYGSNTPVTLNNCYNIGDVTARYTGTGMAGALVYATYPNALTTLTNCYNTGTVTENSATSKSTLAYTAADKLVCTNCYYIDTTATPTTTGTVDAATAVTAAMMNKNGSTSYIDVTGLNRPILSSNPEKAYTPGTEANPYLIASKEDLRLITQYPSAYFKQTADIAEEITEPVAECFSGVYDGNGKYLTLNLAAAANTMNNYGLFRELNGATVKNLTLKGSISYQGTYVGALAGAVTGASSSSPTVTTITNCVNEVNNTMPNTNYVGGLIGGQPTLNVSKIVFENCVNKGNFGTATSGQGYWVGGLLGRGDGYVTINNCVNMGNLYIPSGDSVGGLVGWGYGTIKNSYNLGNITAKTKVSGGTGIFRGSVATENFYNLGTITALNANGYASAFANQAWGATASAKNSYNAGEIVSPMKASYHILLAVESATVKATYDNCYALTADAAADGISGITNVQIVNQAGLKAAALGSGFTCSATAAYPYPQIASNPQSVAWDFTKLTVTTEGNGTSSYAGTKYVKSGSYALTLTPADADHIIGSVSLNTVEMPVTYDETGDTVTLSVSGETATIAVVFAEKANKVLPTIGNVKNYPWGAKNITFAKVGLGSGYTVTYGIIWSDDLNSITNSPDSCATLATADDAQADAAGNYGVALEGKKGTYYLRAYADYVEGRVYSDTVITITAE